MTTIRNKMEKWFESLARLIYHNRLKTLFIMFVIIAAIVSQLPNLTIDISTEGFMHKSDPARVDYDTFRDQFGRDELIIIAIRSPEVFKGNFLKKLKELHEDISENVPYIEDITSLINARNTRGEKDELIVEDLMDNWPETPEDIAVIKQRTLENQLYKNLLISEDSKVTTIVIRTQTYSSVGTDSDVLDGFEDEAKNLSATNDKLYLTDKENSEVVAAVNKIADKYRSSDFEIYIAGSSAVTHFLKQSMIKDVRRFLLLAFITVGAFLFIMFRRITGVILPLLIVILSLVSTISLMAAFKAPIKLPTQILPSFMLAVSVGYSVHILSMFYHNFRKSRSREEAIVFSMGHSGLAVVMTAATTAGGLFSFSTSEVAPIADVGIFAGTGVLLAMVYTIILLPALLALIPVKIVKNKKDLSEDTTIDRFLAKIGRISTGHPYKILVISTVIIAFSIAGIMKIRFSHDVLKWLPKTNSVRIATEKIDKELRGSVSLEIVLDTGKENGLYDPDILNRMEKTAAYLETLEAGKVFAGKAWSLTTILKETNRALNENQQEFYAIPQNKKLIAQELLLFENSGSDDMEDFTDSHLSKARLMVKVPFVDATAYTKFLETVSDHLQKTYPDVKITVTGMAALMFRTVVNAIASMAKSYIYALIVITILMVILIGRFRIGLLSMVPNLTPIIVTLGIMGWLQIPMNLFTMLVGNIAIGLAVDDTIHFMHNFRRYFEESKNAKLAVMETLHTTGRAMLVTSCVLSIGFFIFMFASMNNLIHFGFLTGLAIILALLADYFIAPALMVVVNRPIKTVN
ncbi:efflux RND transporter permease subunit [Desulfobacula sp.]|uniref:efflux RND transporter permease subunit n=1 Tax=Desulfobacula sp. TaxID=2593537 RepID=UPI0025BE4B6D|nr:efflux RND transporter permease subunit [Desulfobacula sp.]MBC2704717.1 MMPL family transporter [Desulfobacula sp.]